MKLQRALIVFAAATFTAGASAQTLKPGLWEITNTMKGGGQKMEQALAQAQQQIASMPPEQRKRMEEMMAKHGMQMGAPGPGGMSARMCMTKEMVERNEVAAHPGECKTTRQPRSGNTMKFTFACTNPPSSGEGQYTFVSPEAYTVKMTVTTTVQGKRETMNMDASGKWLSADCGNVKPMRPPARK
jgi:hypothetical protein